MTLARENQSNEIDGNKQPSVVRHRGKVKWFTPSRGYGFIEREGQADIFVHYKDIQAEGYRELSEGQTVDFEIAQTPKGPKAQNVVVVK